MEFIYVKYEPHRIRKRLLILEQRILTGEYISCLDSPFNTLKNYLEM